MKRALILGPPWISLLAILFLLRPYRGIYHDAHLYAVQTLNRLGTPGLANDVYFTSGNQDSFTTFTMIYAPLVRALGLSQANALFYVLGLALWFGALAILARVLFEDRKLRLFAMASALALQPYYGNVVLSYGEGFVTPRVLAEALGLLAIAATLRRSFLYGLFALLGAAVLHPLAALVTGAFCLWIIWPSLVAFSALSISCLIVALGLGWAGIEPFSWVWQRIDPEWYALIAQYDPTIFPHFWGLYGLLTLPVKGFALAVVAIYAPPHHARIARGILLVTAGLMAITLVGADLMANRLVAGLQLWRVLYLFALFGNLFAIYAMLLLPKRLWLPVGLALAVNFGEFVFEVPAYASSVAILAVAGALVIETWRERPLAMVGRLARNFVLGLACIAFLAIPIARVVLHNDPKGVIGLILGAVAVVALALWAGKPERGPVVFAMALAALIGTVVQIDHRGSWDRYVEDGPAAPVEVLNRIKGKTVHWESGLDLMWLKFRHPQFYSCRQKAGMVFFRDHAFEIDRRATILSELNTADFTNTPDATCWSKAQPGRTGPDDAGQLGTVCSKLPELDLVVSVRKLPGLFKDFWEISPSVDASSQAPLRTYYFYDCRDFRKS